MRRMVEFNCTVVTFCVFFYCVMCMHSSDCAVVRRLSVRPSVCHTPIFCLNG